jgi:four helix bundle protein
MAAVQTFTDLISWQKARVWSKEIRVWSKEIFECTEQKRFSGDQRLVVQINDSSNSLMANIAEGFGRGTQGEFVLFLGYSIGSLNETQSHLCAAYDRRYITKDEFAKLFPQGTKIRKIIVGFIGSMVMPKSGVKNVKKYVNWTEQVWENYERITGQKRPPLFETNTAKPGKKKYDDTPPA